MSDFNLDISSTINITVPPLEITYQSSLSGEVEIEVDRIALNIASTIRVLTSSSPVVYVGNLPGIVELAGKWVPTDITCKIEPLITESPIVYEGAIYGNAVVEGIPHDVDLGSKLYTAKILFDKLLGCSAQMDPIDYDDEDAIITGTTDLQAEPYDVLVIAGELEYVPTESEIDIPSKVFVIYKIKEELEGFVRLPFSESISDIECTMEVPQSNVYLDLLDGCVVINGLGVKQDILNGEFKYEARDIDTDTAVIEGLVFIGEWNLKADINSLMWVPWYAYIYSIPSKINAVRGLDLDIESTVEVFNDQIYDLEASVNLATSAYESIFNGECTLPPFVYNEINGEVEVEKTDTRRDISCYLYAASGVNAEIDCNMVVETPFSLFFLS